jgi:hypothetical protein
MNIIELAKQAGFTDVEERSVWISDGHWDEELKAFAKLVAAHEREECAKICDDMDSISDYYTLRVELICAQAIRARSNT